MRVCFLGEPSAHDLGQLTTRPLQLYAVLPLVYCITTMFIKISLLALFLRIFSPSRIVRRMIWIGLVFITLSFSAAAIAYIVFFFPPSSGEGWSDPKIARQRADSTAYINLILGALGASTDFYVIAIPITAVSSLNLSKKKKIGVSALFATGLMYVFPPREQVLSAESH